MNKRLIDRFMTYVKVDTQSDPDSKAFPTTQKQFDLAKIVFEELQALGLEDVTLDENCYVTATLKGNVNNVPRVGFVAHFDTSPDFSGLNVNPILHQNYNGDSIYLNEETILTQEEFPFLANLVGQDIITTDGSTLLGADDKAGISEIMEMLYVLRENPQIPHGDICVLFTPDEEVGQGTDKVNLENFKVDFAYTVDGGELGELEYENFNAASMKIVVHGRNIHPGTAKHKMKNAIQIGMDFHQALPVFETPQYTEGYEGFYHLNDIEGSVEHAELFYIIRDHHKETFEKKKSYALKVAALINDKYGQGTLEIHISDSYSNMREKIEPVMFVVDYAKAAMEACGVVPLIKPIRGGTDGARLSYMGIPTPNIFTGGYNYHGRYEMISVHAMEKCVEVLVNLVQQIAKHTKA